MSSGADVGDIDWNTGKRAHQSASMVEPIGPGWNSPGSVIFAGLRTLLSDLSGTFATAATVASPGNLAVPALPPDANAHDRNLTASGRDMDISISLGQVCHHCR